MLASPHPLCVEDLEMLNNVRKSVVCFMLPIAAKYIIHYTKTVRETTLPTG